MSRSSSKRRDPIVCYCNEVPLSEVVAALDDGARTMADIFDRTWAGCGPCGGTCQSTVLALIRDYQDLPEGPEDRQRSSRRP
jgi:bacterioferritin-associated ferredoxin